MLQLTSKATRHLIELRRERGVDERAGARFVSKGGRVGLIFASAPEQGDRVLGSAEILVYVPPEIADASTTPLSTPAAKKGGWRWSFASRPDRPKPRTALTDPCRRLRTPDLRDKPG